jgi:hypothetical protein
VPQTAITASHGQAAIGGVCHTIAAGIAPITD